MKKLLVSLLALLALTTAVRAQDYNFGVRIGYGGALSTEISLQRFFGDINRAEVDLGMRFLHRSILDNGKDAEKITYYGGPTLTSAYHWHWFLAGGLGVFGGPAFQLSIPHWDSFGLGLGGQIGFDYQFDAPFQFSLDFRPIYNVIGKFKGVDADGKTRILGGFDPNVSLGVRYSF